MAPPGRTIGEELAGVSRAARWSLAIINQVHAAVWYTALLVCLPLDLADPLYYSRVPWRLPMLLSMYAYTSLALLVMSHVELSLPRVPLAAYQALLLYGAFLAGFGGIVGPLGAVVLGLPVVDIGVVAGCTFFVAGLIAGLLVVWAWLVRQYSVMHTPSVPAPVVLGRTASV